MRMKIEKQENKHMHVKDFVRTYVELDSRLKTLEEK